MPEERFIQNVGDGQSQKNDAPRVKDFVKHTQGIARERIGSPSHQQAHCWAMASRAPFLKPGLESRTLFSNVYAQVLLPSHTA